MDRTGPRTASSRSGAFYRTGRRSSVFGLAVQSWAVGFANGHGSAAIAAALDALAEFAVIRKIVALARSNVRYLRPPAIDRTIPLVGPHADDEEMIAGPGAFVAA